MRLIYRPLHRGRPGTPRPAVLRLGSDRKKESFYPNFNLSLSQFVSRYILRMDAEFEWDPTKAESNYQKHAVSFY